MYADRANRGDTDRCDHLCSHSICIQGQSTGSQNCKSQSIFKDRSGASGPLFCREQYVPLRHLARMVCRERVSPSPNERCRNTPSARLHAGRPNASCHQMHHRLWSVLVQLCKRIRASSCCRRPNKRSSRSALQPSQQCESKRADADHRLAVFFQARVNN